MVAGSHSISMGYSPPLSYPAEWLSREGMLLDTLLIHCTTYSYSYYYSYISVCVMYLSEKCCFMLSGMGIRGLPSFQRTGIYSLSQKNTYQGIAWIRKFCQQLLQVCGYPTQPNTVYIRKTNSGVSYSVLVNVVWLNDDLLPCRHLHYNPRVL